MRFSAVVVPLLALTCIAFPSFAVADGHTITILSYRTCKQWTDHIKKEGADPLSYSVLLDKVWLAGFLSALNADHDRDLLGAIDLDTVAAWMTKYCTSNPSKDLFEGARKLFGELDKLTPTGQQPHSKP
jgi:hypothetical protein